jgi:hypothetical protein
MTKHTDLYGPFSPPPMPFTSHMTDQEIAAVVKERAHLIDQIVDQMRHLLSDTSDVRGLNAAADLKDAWQDFWHDGIGTLFTQLDDLPSEAEQHRARVDYGREIARSE